MEIVAFATDTGPSVNRDITQPIHKFSWFKLGALVALVCHDANRLKLVLLILHTVE